MWKVGFVCMVAFIMFILPGMIGHTIHLLCTTYTDSERSKREGGMYLTHSCSSTEMSTFTQTPRGSLASRRPASTVGVGDKHSRALCPVKESPLAQPGLDLRRTVCTRSLIRSHCVHKVRLHVALLTSPGLIKRSAILTFHSFLPLRFRWHCCRIAACPLASRRPRRQWWRSTK